MAIGFRFPNPAPGESSSTPTRPAMGEAISGMAAGSRRNLRSRAGSSSSLSRPWPRSSWLPNSLASDGRIARTRFTPPRISAPAWRRGLFAPSFDFAHFIREMIATRSFHAEPNRRRPSIASGRRCGSAICVTTCASPAARRTKRSFPSSTITLVAADRTGRMCRRVEFDPLYFDVIVRRYEAARRRRALKYARQSLRQGTR